MFGLRNKKEEEKKQFEVKTSLNGGTAYVDEVIRELMIWGSTLADGSVKYDEREIKELRKNLMYASHLLKKGLAKLEE